MIVEQATPGVLVCDSLPYTLGGSAKIAAALAAEGVKCLVGYLGGINVARVQFLLDAGIAFMPVTYGMTPDHYSGPTSIKQAKALGYPEGGTIWLDVEGMSVWHTDPAVLMADVSSWGKDVAAAGFRDALYVGVPQPLNSVQLYSVHESLYWHGQGEVRDLKNKFADPACGWAMRQKYPSILRGGIKVDDNTLQADSLGRLPYWAVAA